MSKPLFKVQTLSVYISTTLVLLLLGVIGVLYVAGREVAKGMQESMGVSVVIYQGAGDAEVNSIKDAIKKGGYAQDIKYISAEEALKEEMEELKMNPVEQLGYNPYEASFELTLKPEYNNAEKLENIEEELLRNDNVKEVIYQKELMGEVNNSIRKAGIAMLVLLVMLTLISWSQISNLVRLSIYSKRFLLHTMKLTGATWGFIRRPFILNGMLTGFLSGIFANGILAAILYATGKSEPDIMVYFPTDKLIYVGITVIIFGITICSLCAYFSVNRFLRMRNNDLYFI